MALLEGPDPLPIRSILALTFTEKAAQELRSRIRDECRVRMNTDGNSAYWRGVVRGLEAAPIGTFHSYCGNLLRRFPLEAGVEPGFAILEEAVAPSIREAALARMVRTWLASQDPDFAAVAVEMGIAGARQAIGELVGRGAGVDFRGLGARTPAETLERWIAAWGSIVLKELPARIAKLAEPAFQLFDDYQCEHAVMNERIATLRELVPRAELEGLAGRLEAIESASAVQGGGGKSAWPSPEVYEAVKAALTSLREGVRKLRPNLEIDPDASAGAAELVGRLARLASVAVEAAETARRARGALDFEDLLVKARDLLRDGPPAVVESIRAEVRAILVDEFQDTNAIQAEILELLADKSRLYLVGDANQSIYRFRGAKPDLFASYRDVFPEPGRLDLTENRRSAPGIISFVNTLFAEAFDNAPPLLPRSTGYADPVGPALTLLWAPGGDGDGRNKPSADERRRGEAVALAQFIKVRIDEGLSIWDTATKSTRPARAGDVAILLRSLNDAAAYESALEAEGLDYYLVGGSAFFAQQEVIDLINILSLLEDPTDEISLAASLRSPFFGLSDEGLYWLSDSGRGELASGLANLDRAHDLSETDRERAARARSLIDRWRALKDHASIAEVLDTVLSESGYEAALLGEHLGERRRANARKLVRMAQRFDAQGGLTLADFAARLRADLRRPPREEQAATTDEGGDAVLIMSIHQAKGLEYPIVAVPDLDRKPPIGHATVALDDDLGLFANFEEGSDNSGADADRFEASDEAVGGRNLGWRLYREIERQEEAREAIRLFYVATTRAREHLILSAGVGPEAKPTSPALKLLADRFDRADGRPIGPTPARSDVPEVAVRIVLPEPRGDRRRKAGPRPERAAQMIARTTVIDVDRSLPPPRVPRRVELDPLERLDRPEADILRIVRAVLDEPGALLDDPDQRSRTAHRLAGSLAPMPSRAVVDEAVRRLSGFLDDLSSAASRTATRIIAGRRWLASWLMPAGSTVYSGRVDLALIDEAGDRRLLVFSTEGVPESAERLRLQLSARVQPGPIVEGWAVRLAAGGPVVSRESRFDEHSIAEAVHEWIADSR